MERIEKIEKIISSQKNDIHALEMEIAEIKASDATVEHEKMQDSMNDLGIKISELNNQIISLTREKERLIGSEKDLVNTVKHYVNEERAKAYSYEKENIYQANTKFMMEEHQQLEQVTNQYKKNLAAIRHTIEENQLESDKDILRKMLSIEESINDLVANRQQDAEIIAATTTHRTSEQLESAEKIFLDRTDIPIYPPKPTFSASEGNEPKENIEFKIGLNATNILGIFLIVLGVIFGLQYAYNNILKSDVVKAALAYGLGIIFLVAGEIFHRKHAKGSVFSLGLTSAGVAILFASTGIAYFVFQIMPIPTALLMIVLTTTVSFILSLRYNFQLISIFALLGGYIPIITFLLPNMNAYLGVMGYLILLNVYALFIAIKKDWTVIKFSGLILNVVASFYLLYSSGFTHEIIMLFVQIMFIIYAFVAFIYPARQNKPLQRSSLVMVLINTVAHGVLVYLIVSKFSTFDNYYGTTTIILALLYYFLAKYVERHFRESSIRSFFYGVATVMAILAVPLQVNRDYISLVWLLEAIVFIIIGIRNKNKTLSVVGSVIYALCIGAFVLFDLQYGSYSSFYLVRLSFVVGGLWLIMLYMRYDNRVESSMEQRVFRWLQSGLSVITFFYIQYVALFIQDKIITLHHWDYELVMPSVVVFITFTYAILLGRLDHLLEKSMAIFRIVLEMLALIVTITLGIFIFADSQLPVIIWALHIANILLSALAITSMADLLLHRHLVRRSHKSMVLAVYGLIILNQIVFLSFNWSNPNMLTSFLLVFDAAALVLLGFILRYERIRKLGLLLELLAVSKFFIFDLSYLESLERIISYFVLGIILLSVSYIYQIFDKRLQVIEKEKNEVTPTPDNHEIAGINEWKSEKHKPETDDNKDE